MAALETHPATFRPRHARPATWDPAQREGAQMMRDTLAQWRAQGPRPDLWVFGYASLVWRPEFDAAEQRLARVHGHHRSLQMWSRVNRGTPERPGLVFALMAGGSCSGLALRVPHERVEALMPTLWAREMPNPVYDPKWLLCQTAQGPPHPPRRARRRALPRDLSPLGGSLRQHAGLCAPDMARPARARHRRPRTGKSAAAGGRFFAPTLHRCAGRRPPRGLIRLGAARRRVCAPHAPPLRGSLCPDPTPILAA